MRRIAGVLAVVAALIASMFVATQPASADWTDCGVGLSCVWTGPTGTGSKYVISFSGSGGVGRCNYLGIGNPWSNVNVSYRVGFGSGHGLHFYHGLCSGPSIWTGWPGDLYSWSPGDGAYMQMMAWDVW